MAARRWKYGQQDPSICLSALSGDLHSRRRRRGRRASVDVRRQRSVAVGHRRRIHRDDDDVADRYRCVGRVTSSDAIHTAFL